MNPWIAEHLVCPRDHRALHPDGDGLRCSAHHRYPVFDGIPIMLVDDVATTHDSIRHTLDSVAGSAPASADPRVRSAANDAVAGSSIVDPFVQAEVPYTSGIMYYSAQHRLTRYPIPTWRGDTGDGGRLLDVGCNWGRWSISAARCGHRPVGIDPSLDAVLAARRVATQLGSAIDLVVGDARYLPFRRGSFERVFSYGVLQHFAKVDAKRSLAEFARVLAPGGTTLVQMANRRGVRQYQQHRRRGFTEGTGFEVRYWTPPELLATFEEIIGASTLRPDCYFGLGIQPSDADLLARRYRVVVHASECLRIASRWIPPLRRLADSVYVHSSHRTTSSDSHGGGMRTVATP